MAKHIYRGSGAPNFVPEDVGHHYVDVLTKDAYLSVGTNSPADWVIAAGFSVSNGIVINTMDGDETTLSPSVVAVKSYILNLINSVVANQMVVEYKTLNDDEIANRSITLEHAPASEIDVTLDLVGGGAQVLGDDFTVTGDVISWDGLPLQDILSIGDKLRVSYSKANTL
jgi:hypothetical protein